MVSTSRPATSTSSAKPTPRKSAGRTPKKGSKRSKAKDDSDSEEFEDDVKEYDSDALDDDSGEDGAPKKRKRASPTKKNTRSPRKKAKTSDATDEEFELEEGQEVVGVVVQAPKTGKVPPGQISKNTLDFLTHLKDPECNDREWFKLHEPVYRQAETEWKDFVEVFTDLLSEADDQIPPLPPKDVIHRIYRDVRFSNDKTPYKKGFSASFSRSGRKGIFAAYHVAVIPGGKSLIAAGSWAPGKNELATIRLNIQHDPLRLRNIISAPEFERLFGQAKPDGGKRCNIFGADDELKVAPKGIDKAHKDIDLLKCRSFAVVHHFSDEEVLDPDFKQTLVDIVAVVRPLVHCLNDMMTIRPDSDDEDDEE